MAGQLFSRGRVTEAGQVVCWDGQRLGVLLGTVQGVAEVLHPSVPPPAQTRLDVAIRETLAVKQVARGHSDGVR